MKSTIQMKFAVSVRTTWIATLHPYAHVLGISRCLAALAVRISIISCELSMPVMDLTKDTNCLFSLLLLMDHPRMMMV
jgi:hypothetical protein